MGEAHPHHRALEFIGVYKVARGLLFLAVAVGMLSLVNRDLDSIAYRVLKALHADPENRYIHRLIARIVQVDPRRLKAIGVGSFVYAALSLTEGVGLILEKRWAEYMTVITTSAFIPVEVYEVLHRVTIMRASVLIFNVLVVAYVISLLRQKPERNPGTGA